MWENACNKRVGLKLKSLQAVWALKIIGSKMIGFKSAQYWSDFQNLKFHRKLTNKRGEY